MFSKVLNFTFIILMVLLWACKSIEEPEELPQYWESVRSWATTDVVDNIFELTPENSMVYTSIGKHNLKFFNELTSNMGLVGWDSLHIPYQTVWLGGDTFVSRMGTLLLKVVLTNTTVPVVETLENPTDLRYFDVLLGESGTLIAVPESSQTYLSVSLSTLERIPLFEGIKTPEYGIEVQDDKILDRSGILYDFYGNVIFSDTSESKFFIFGPDTWLIFSPEKVREYIGTVNWHTSEVRWIFLPEIYSQVTPFWFHEKLYIFKVRTTTYINFPLLLIGIFLRDYDLINYSFMAVRNYEFLEYNKNLIWQQE